MKLVRPTLLLDEVKCKKNIQHITEKARKAHVKLRPHFKTHQSHVVGAWFREVGINSCTVSSIKMAAYFARDGWDDITVAFPLNYLEVEEINRLAKVCKLNLCIVSVDALKKLTEKLTQSIHCQIEVDTGYHRTGVDPTNYPAIDEIVSFISTHPLLTFKGFLSHAGHSYAARSSSEILKIHMDSVALMKTIGDRYRNKFPKLELSVGDTPTCSVATDFSSIDEVRPGNLVFYDLMQRVIGACTSEQIAIAMACPVVAIYPERNEVIVHGGGVHFSKDFLKTEDGTICFGEVVKLTSQGWEQPARPVYVKSLSQEHGILAVPAPEIQKIKIGDVLGILPVHACLTADAMGEYVTLDGKVIEAMAGSA